MLNEQKRLKRRRKSYYPFSKDYPGMSHSSYAIGETREKHKREQKAQILFVLSMLLLFLLTFCIVFVALYLSQRPIHENAVGPSVSAKESIVALEMPEDALNGGIALDLFLEDLNTADANAAIVEFKRPNGFLNYPSAVSTAKDLGAAARAYPTFAQSLARLKEQGYSIIAKYACFEDTLAAASLPGAAVTLADGVSLWLDESAQKNGNPWLNPYSDEACRYLLSLLQEAPSLGADYVLLESVQFPTGRFAATAFFPYAAQKGISKNAVLLDFLQKAGDAVGDIPLSVTLSVSDVLYGNPTAYDGFLQTAAVDFLTVDFTKSAQEKEALAENHAPFAALEAEAYFSAALPAVQEKVKTDAPQKPILVRSDTLHSFAQMRDAKVQHGILKSQSRA